MNNLPIKTRMTTILYSDTDTIMANKSLGIDISHPRASTVATFKT